MVALALTLGLAAAPAAALAAAPDPAPAAALAAVQAAAQAALALPGARVEVLGLEGAPPAGCPLGRAELPAPVAGSGRVAVRLGSSSASCAGWVWARLRVTAPALVAARDLADGEPLAGAAQILEREVLPGNRPLSALPPGARAARPLRAGTPLQPEWVRVGPRPGEPVAVVLHAGSLSVEQQARALPCHGGRACALLPSGRRVEGAWHDGRIELEVP